MTMKIKPVPIVALLFSVSALMALVACKPVAAPQPEVFKAQHDALDKAKGLEKQMQQQLQDRMKEGDTAAEDKK